MSGQGSNVSLQVSSESSVSWRESSVSVQESSVSLQESSVLVEGPVYRCKSPV